MYDSEIPYFVLNFITLFQSVTLIYQHANGAVLNLKNEQEQHFLEKISHLLCSVKAYKFIVGISRHFCKQLKPAKITNLINISFLLIAFLKCEKQLGHMCMYIHFYCSPELHFYSMI